MVIGDDMTCIIPYEPRSRLRAAFFFALQRLGCRVARHDLNHRGRVALEQLDRGAFKIREAAARLYRSGRRCRKQQAVDVRLRDIDTQHDQQCDYDNSGQAVAHRISPNSSERTIEQARTPELVPSAPHRRCASARAPGLRAISEPVRLLRAPIPRATFARSDPPTGRRPRCRAWIRSTALLPDR